MLAVAVPRGIPTVAVGIADAAVGAVDDQLDLPAFGGAHGDGDGLGLGARALEEAAAPRATCDEGGAAARGDDVDVALAACGRHGRGWVMSVIVDAEHAPSPPGAGRSPRWRAPVLGRLRLSLHGRCYDGSGWRDH